MRRFWMLAVALVVLLAGCAESDGDGANRTSATSTPASGSPTAATGVVATTEVAQSTTEPTTASEPTAVDATAVPESGDPDVVVGKWKMSPRAGGFVYVQGDLINQGAGDAVSVEVVITMKDAAGAILASQSGYYLGIIRAGGKAAWTAVVANVDPAQVATTDMIVQWDGLRGSFYDEMYRDSFTFSNVQWTEDHIVGEVTNTSDKSMSLTQITIVGYDEAGEIFDVQVSFAQLDTIAPGETSPFTAGTFGIDGVPASWELFVYGSVAP